MPSSQSLTPVARRSRFAAEFDARAATPRPYQPTCLITGAAQDPTVARVIAEERRYADERPMRRAFRP